MDQMIDEINENHMRIVNKITELEKKIELTENCTQIKTTKQLTKQEIEAERQRLLEENKRLKHEVNQLCDTLNALEANRKPNNDLVLNSDNNLNNNNSINANNNSGHEKSDSPDKEVTERSNETKTDKKSAKKSNKNESKANPKNVNTSDDNKPVDVSRLDLRVGRILTARKHPDADALYVEEIDCGEEKPRTVVSGLVRFVPLEQMQNRLVVVLCNLKAAKMRGITSEAMVMCASSADAVQILDPPEGSLPGDRVTFDKYPGTPDTQLNPKKKIWEQVAPDLKTDSNCVATYKGSPFLIASKGMVCAKSLANVQVK